MVGPDHHDALRLGERKWLKEESVHHAEDGGVGSDAERERQDGCDAEAGALGQDANGVAYVLKQRAHSSPRSAFSYAVRSPIRLKLWNTKPISRLRVRAR